MLLKLPPPHPFAFPLSPISLLAFASSFLPPVFISILSFCNLDLISCHVFDIRSGHLHFQGQNFLYFFPFVCSIFFSYTLFFGFVCFQCFPCYYFCSCSTDFSLIRESNSLSDYRPVRLLSLEPRILSSLYHFISGCNSLVSTFPSDGSGFKWYIRWLRFFSNLIERSSGIAVSCFSVLAVYSVSYFLMRGFQFFRFIYMPFLLYAL